MRTIERTSRFKREYKRESRGRHRAYLDAILASVVDTLANDRRREPLPTPGQVAVLPVAC
ncbi:hypothetical protein [Candidatus Palauibacter sp.]|uniref:hypothetical protein n=1 Tax=Candidatus Palauibacter sp. TaxID=3101350 RepID=UPI003B525346